LAGFISATPGHTESTYELFPSDRRVDHFGIQVDDVGLVRERVAKKWPRIEIIQRPGNGPFAALGIHDPAGTYFDLSQKGLKNRGQVYEKPSWEQERVFSPFALRAMEPD
jgi:hypothetical protein